MTKWEYKTSVVKASFTSTEKTKDRLEEECNRMGEDGWELVNFQAVESDLRYMLVFKRKREL